MRLVLLFLLLSTVLLADVTGRWTGSIVFDGPNGEKVPGTVLLVLKQDGNTVTGTVGPSEEAQKPIQNGKAEENVIIFNVEVREGVSMKFTLKQTGEEISGELSGEHDNQKMTATLSLKREK